MLLNKIKSFQFKKEVQDHEIGTSEEKNKKKHIKEEGIEKDKTNKNKNNKKFKKPYEKDNEYEFDDFEKEEKNNTLSFKKKDNIKSQKNENSDANFLQKTSIFLRFFLIRII